MTDEIPRVEPGDRPADEDPETTLPFDPADKTQPAEGGRNEVEENFRRADAERDHPDSPPL